MKSVIHWAIRNSPAMNMFLITALVIGAVSLVIMRREVFPEFELEIVVVSAVYPGATPEETEEAICEKIEAAIAGVDGVKKYTSIARENSGNVLIELNANVKNVQKVMDDLRAQVDQIQSFPASVEKPEVRQIVFKAPAISIGILGPDDDQLDPLTRETQLREIAEGIRVDLLQLEAAKPKNFLRKLFHPLIAPAGRNAISTANIVAAKDYQIDVEVPEEQLRNYGLSISQIANAIRQQNSESPGGKMETAGQEMLLRGNPRKELGHEIAQLPIRALPNGDVLFLNDIASVVDGFTDSTSHHRVDGQPAIVISVARTADEDLFTVVDTVKEYASTKVLPPGYRLKLWQDISSDVRDRIELLSRNGLQGLLLVFLVLAIFLDLRLAFWVALGIPVSILGAGFVLLMFGQTLNMLSMFAFLMALGIVVDDAIVIGENIYQKRQQGMGPIKAAVEGTVEVVPSVCASVMTTIIAFAPLLYVTGVMGKFIAVMPLAVIAMLIISLIESIFVLPCHLGHEKNLFFRMMGVTFFIFRPLLIPFRFVNRNATRGMEWAVERVYMPVLHWSLHHKPIVVSTAIGFIIFSSGLIAAGIVPFDAFPKLDSRNISATVAFPDGTASWAAIDATQKMEQALYEVEKDVEVEYGHKILNLVYQKVGEAGRGNGITGVSQGSHVGTVEVELTQPGEREITSQQIIERWRKKVPEIAGAEVVKFGSQGMGPGGNKIEFKLLAVADSVVWLEDAAEECKNWLKKKEGVTDIEDDMRLGKYEMNLKLNETGRSLGLDEASITRTVRSAYYGEEVMRLQRGRHEVKLMVRLPENDRKSMAGFEEIRVRDNNNVERPLLDVAEIEFNRADAEINRLGGKRSITVTADIDKSSGAEAAPIIEEMRTEFLPELFRRYKAEHSATLYVDWEGEQAQTMESMSSMAVGFSIACLAMFVLLTLEFRSYLQPAIILTIIPFGFIGAVFGHAILGLELTLFSMFGLVALTGVVVNDSIVLVDFINHRLREGMSLYDALIETGRRRFRPVMLTSITTVAGLFPMLLETSMQAQVLIPMAASLVFGLITGTMLILILVPVFYQIYGIVAGLESIDPSPDDYEKSLAEERARELVGTH